ncbi:MAG: hypothetical protein AAGH15_28735, partial [Myxococcota bacterium]
TFPSTVPRPATLRRWRSSLEAPLDVGLVVPYGARVSDAGPYRRDEALDERIGWVLEAAEAAEAAFLVLPTGSELTTSARDRERFARYLEALRPNERPVVWSPAGLWEAELAYPFAAKLGVRCAFDPLQDPAPPGDGPLHARLKALGGRQRFGDGVLYDLVDKLEDAGPGRAYVAFESPRSFREALRLQELAGGLPAPADDVDGGA